MKKTAKLFSLFSLLILSHFAAKQTLANVSVNISGNGAGSTSHVNVQSSTTSNSTSSNNSNTSTHIRIENNGEVKTYDSQNGEDVSIQSSDGNAKVNISNKVNTNSTSQNNSSIKTEIKNNVNGIQTSIESSSSASPSALPTPDIVITPFPLPQIENHQNIWDYIKKFFDSLFK